MKIPLKTPSEIKLMQLGGKKLSQVLRQVLAKAEAGVALKDLEVLACDLIEKAGGRPSFKMVRNYHWATCLNVNQGVVHGVPDDYRLKKGDLLSVDVGIYFKGFHTDMARTIEIGDKRDASQKFLKVGQRALKKAIDQVSPGNRVGHLSEAIETEIKKAGYQPVEALTGHGVGSQLHESPAIPGFLKGKIEETALLDTGMVLAIEVIYSQGNTEIKQKDDHWTLETADGSLAALFEKTVALTEKGPLILTDY